MKTHSISSGLLVFYAAGLVVSLAIELGADTTEIYPEIPRTVADEIPGDPVVRERSHVEQILRPRLESGREDPSVGREPLQIDPIAPEIVTEVIPVTGVQEYSEVLGSIPEEFHSEQGPESREDFDHAQAGEDTPSAAESAPFELGALANVNSEESATGDASNSNEEEEAESPGGEQGSDTTTTSIHQTDPDMSRTTLRNTRTTSYSTSSVSTIYDRTIEDQIWYLGRGGMNVFEAWEQCVTGRGISVAVVDDGVHEDNLELSNAYDRVNSLDVSTRRVPGHTYARSLHGTMTAGIIANSPTRGQCGVGVAYGAKIIDIRLPFGEELGDDVEARAFRHAVAVTDIYSNSWGPSERNQLLGVTGPRTLAALSEGIHRGRAGKGAIYVWAAGNGGINGNSCAYDGYVNCRYTIPVAGVTRSGRKLRSGERCSAIMAATYSQHSSDDDIITSDGTRSCERHFSDSSLATPFASGIIALVLQANPNLSWRDVQHIIAETGDYVPSVSGWKQNAAGYDVNSALGFGLMNAGKMVRLAKVWSPVVPPATSCVIESPRRTVRIPIQGELSIPIRVPQRCRIDRLEHVEVVVDLTFTRRGHVKASLSHGRMESVLLPGRLQDVYNNTLKNWRVVSVHFWGENPRTDEWTLKLANAFRQYRGSGVLRSWKVVMYGTDGWTPTELPSRTNRECTVNYNRRPISDADDTPTRRRFPSVHTTQESPSGGQGARRRNIPQSRLRDCTNELRLVKNNTVLDIRSGQYHFYDSIDSAEQCKSYCFSPSETDVCRSVTYFQTSKKCSINLMGTTEVAMIPKVNRPAGDILLFDRTCQDPQPSDPGLSCTREFRYRAIDQVLHMESRQYENRRDVYSVQRCQELCVGNCKSITFFTRSHRCTLNKVNSTDVRTKDKPTGTEGHTYIYDRICTIEREPCTDEFRSHRARRVSLLTNPRTQTILVAGDVDSWRACKERCVRTEVHGKICKAYTFGGYRCSLHNVNSSEVQSRDTEHVSIVQNRICTQAATTVTPTGRPSYPQHYGTTWAPSTRRFIPTTHAATIRPNQGVFSEPSRATPSTPSAASGCQSQTFIPVSTGELLRVGESQRRVVYNDLLHQCKRMCKRSLECKSITFVKRRGDSSISWCYLNAVNSWQVPRIPHTDPTTSAKIFDKGCQDGTSTVQPTSSSSTTDVVATLPNCSNVYNYVGYSKKMVLEPGEYTIVTGGWSHCKDRCNADPSCRSFIYYGGRRCSLNTIMSTDTTLEDIWPRQSVSIYDRICSLITVVRQRPTITPAPGTGASNTGTGCTDQFVLVATDKELRLQDGQYTTRMDISSRSACQRECARDSECRSFTAKADGNGNKICILNKINSTQTTLQSVYQYSSYVYDRFCTALCPVTTQFETFQSDIELDLPANQYREYLYTTYANCKDRCIEDRNCRSITVYTRRCVLNYKRSTETSASSVPSGSRSYFADRSCSGIDE